MQKSTSPANLLELSSSSVQFIPKSNYFFRYSFYAVCATFCFCIQPQNLPTTFLFDGILHNLSFGAIFISGMFGRRIAVFWKFLVHFALAKPTADSDFLLLKDMSQQISQTVGYLNRPRKITGKTRTCSKRFSVSSLICHKI